MREYQKNRRNQLIIILYFQKVISSWDSQRKMKMCIKFTLRVKGYVAQLRVIGIMIIWAFLSKINCPKLIRILKFYFYKKLGPGEIFCRTYCPIPERKKNFFPKNWAGWAGLWFSLPPGRWAGPDIFPCLV